MAAFPPDYHTPSTDYSVHRTTSGRFSAGSREEKQVHPSFKPRYSGPDSGAFWDAVNLLEDDGANELAVVLQDFERDILSRLQRRIDHMKVRVDHIRWTEEER